MFGKEAYKPVDRRFEVSKDKISRERLRAVVDACKTVETTIPKIHFGFSLFGSLSKGKVLRNRSILKFQRGNANRADIDLACFYDDDDAKDNVLLKEKSPKNTSLVDLIGSLDLDSPATVSILEDAAPVSPTIRTLISDGTSLTEDSIRRQQMMHSRVSTIIRENLRNKLRNKVPSQLPTLPIALDGPQSILSHVEKILAFPSGDEYLIEKHAHRLYVALCFGLDLGGGLKRYRQDFLYKLSQLNADTAEQYWQVVDESVREYEREGKVPNRAEKQYPLTFARAVEYYGLPKKSRDAV